MRSILVLPLLCAALTVGALACRASSPATDANSNWLTVCDASTVCATGSTCICGLCTRTCDADAQCEREGVAGACIDPVAASDQEACAAVVRSADTRICLRPCSGDAQCGDGTACTAGSCWARPASLQTPRGIDASMPLADYDAAISFDTPVSPPAPEVVVHVAPDAPDIAGTWRQEILDPPLGGPLRIQVFESAEAGGLVALLTFDCEGCMLLGPVPPGVDAGVDDRLRSPLLPDFPYRLFDGRVSAQSVRFWFTENDVYREWCEQQTPFPSVLEGRAQHSCIEDAKTVLELEALPEEEVTPEQWLCAANASVCRCDADRCVVETATRVNQLDLRPEGDVLRGLSGVFVRDVGETP